MKPLCFVVLYLVVSAGLCQTARACPSADATASLCGGVRQPEPLADVVLGCRPGEELVCAGRLQRLREASMLVSRYKALGQANLDGCVAHR